MKNVWQTFSMWWIVHALHWAVLYWAFAAQVDGAMYVLKFGVWVMAPLSLILLSDDLTKAVAKKPTRPLHEALSWLQAWSTLGLLVWHGHVASGLAWGFVMVMTGAHRHAVKRARAAPETAPSVA